MQTTLTHFDVCIEALWPVLRTRRITIIDCGRRRHEAIGTLVSARLSHAAIHFVEPDPRGRMFAALTPAASSDTGHIAVLKFDADDLQIVLDGAAPWLARQDFALLCIEPAGEAFDDHLLRSRIGLDRALSPHGYRALDVLHHGPAPDRDAGDGPVTPAVSGHVYASPAFRSFLAQEPGTVRTSRSREQMETAGPAPCAAGVEDSATPAGYESTLEELFRLVDELSLSEQQSRADARTAGYKEARLRQRLAFRLGTAIVSDLRPPWRMMRMPLDLLRAYRQYVVDRKSSTADRLPPDDNVRHIRDARLGLVLRIHWQRIVLPQTDKDAELWLKPLCRAGESAALTVEVRKVPLLTACGEIRWVSGSSAGTEQASSITVKPGAAALCCRHRGAATTLELRTTSSKSLVLKIELRTTVPPPGTVEEGIGCSDALSSQRLAAERGNPDVHASVADAIGGEPPMQRQAVLWQAHQLMNAGQTTAGIAFARRHASGAAREAVHLLEANAALPDESAWLKHVNAYLAQFQLAPIELRRGDGTLFSRMTSRGTAHVDSGPVISVIMPAYQAASTIGHAARSVLQQTWRALELIVVDDASDDDTWNILQRLASSDDRVKLLRNVCNVGPYASKNLALGVATGAYITGHDADDWAHPQRLERQMADMLRSGGKTRVSIACMVRMGDHGRFDHVSRQSKGTDDGVLREATMSCMFETAFMRRHLGHWDTVRFAADSEMIARCERVCGAGFARLRQLSIICLDRDTSLTNDPTHGISKTHGVSPTRMVYRDHWTRWHRTIDLDHAYLPFPQQQRRFTAPEAASVPLDRIEQVLRAHDLAMYGTADAAQTPVS